MAYNSQGSSFSNVAGASIIDTTPPTLESVTINSKNSVSAVFSEPVDPASAKNVSNYDIEGIVISQISLNSRTATLTTSDHSEAGGGIYTLTASGVKDLSENTMAPSSINYVYSPVDTTQDLIGYWKLDENSGSQTFDSSAGGNTGELQEAVWADGKFGSALSFNGQDAYVDFGNIAFELTNSLSISLWVNLNNHDEYYQRLFHAGQYAHPFFIRMKGNKINAALRTTSDTRGLLSTTTITTGQWHHVAITYDNEQYRLYINGQQESSSILSGNLSVQNENVMLGICPNSYVDALDGSLDEIRVYKKALTAEEVQALFTYTGPSAGLRIIIK